MKLQSSLIYFDFFSIMFSYFCIKHVISDTNPLVVVQSMEQAIHFTLEFFLFEIGVRKVTSSFIPDFTFFNLFLQSPSYNVKFECWYTMLNWYTFYRYYNVNIEKQEKAQNVQKSGLTKGIKNLKKK